ncbi:MAG: 50S ribosomal protein L25/general stress protein Ctc, partial [Flavobacteriaceae bacterium]|nr:50S ribosomal protein L25/general stress protein Ctc [Flavobacteriaceae bacterium]
ALRNAGQVPCVVYGGDKAIHFSAETLAFKNLVYTPDVHTVVIALEDGSKIDAILQDIQFHPVTDQILHIDFYQIFDDKEVSMEIPVRITGNAPGVRNGGVLRIVRRSLRVKALPKDLPDFLNADISAMKIGSVLTVGNLTGEGFVILQDDSRVVCQVRTSRVAVKDEEDDEEEGEEGEEGTATEGAAKEAPAEE